MPAAPTILVRATINLAGLPVGSYAFVDPSDPFIAGLLRTEALVEEPEDEPAAEAD